MNEDQKKYQKYQPENGGTRGRGAELKTGARAARVLIAVLVLLTLGYFAVQVARYYADPFSTALAYEYELEESLDLSGWVVRDERVLPEASGEYLRLLRKEGERVSAGGVIAESYPDQEALELRTELDNLSDRLEQLKYARDAIRNGDASARIDSQIFQTLLNYRTELAADRMVRAEQTGGQLRSMILRRDYADADLSSIELEIAAAEARIAELNARTARATREITAPESGLWSAVTDGYEADFTPDLIKNITPSELAAITGSESDGSSGLGKLVLGDSWYYAAPLSVTALQDLRRRGGSWTLRFSKGGERDFPVRLDSAGPEEDGVVVAVFRCDSYLPEATVTRRQKAQLIFGTVRGLRVPREALRMPERVTASATPAPDNNINNNAYPASASGQPTPSQSSPTPAAASQSTGLYCIVGTEARFKPITVLYTGDSFLLVAPATPVKEELRLRRGDEVIVHGENLYDRKVIDGNN